MTKQEITTLMSKLGFNLELDNYQRAHGLMEYMRFAHPDADSLDMNASDRCIIVHKGNTDEHMLFKTITKYFIRMGETKKVRELQKILT